VQNSDQNLVYLRSISCTFFAILSESFFYEYERICVEVGYNTVE